MGNAKGVKRDFEALEKRRFEAMRLLDQGLNQSETARRLKVARQTVSAWRRHYLQQGPTALRRAGRAGRKPLLNAAQRQRLTALLLEGPEAHGFPTPLWTCPRVARLIGDEFGVDYHEGHVWKVLRGLGWSPQPPVGQARERDEEAIRTWKRKTWPDTKTKPAPKAARCSSSTKADFFVPQAGSRTAAAVGRRAGRRRCCRSTSTGTSSRCRPG